MSKKYEFDAIIIKALDMDVAYVEVPFDIKAEFDKGRVAVNATFDSKPYNGSLVRMGTLYNIIGIRKNIKSKTGKQADDSVRVTLVDRQQFPGLRRQFLPNS